MEGRMLTTLAEEKWTKSRVIEANRGSILDRNGEVIAKDAPSYTVYAVLDETFTTNPEKPLHVTNPKEAAKKLAPILNTDPLILERYMSKDDVFQTELGASGRNISQQEKKIIEQMKIPGIRFSEETKRYYPNGMFASHVIGYVTKTEENEIEGQMGIEETFDEYMAGEPGKVTFKSDRKGMKLPNPNEMIEPPMHGKDVFLTIDQKIQTFLESALTYVDKEYEPENIMAIVADPKTGEILAMGNRPSFDPNIRNITDYLNNTIAYRFEPGSTMKVFTLSAAINEGVFNPSEKYQSGTYRYSKYDKPIGDHNNGLGWGEITFLEGVQRSSNVAFAILVNEKLGTGTFEKYLHRFDFHKKTGIDLPGEVPGNILFQYLSEKITTAFGQGTAITPIQQVKAATAIANDGKMMKPYVTKKVVDPSTGDIIIEGKSEVVGEPISAETAKRVRTILETVITSPEGTGKRYSVDGYDIAGKTGTAQIPDPKTGSYMIGRGNNIFSFIGMGPTENPRLLMYVAVKQPKLKPTESGHEAVSYIFRNVMKNSLHYLNVEPNKQSEMAKDVVEEGITIGSYTGKPVETIKHSLMENGIDVTVIGSGKKVLKQVPHEDTKLLLGDRVLLKTGGDMKMPDLTGWSLRDVFKLSYLLKLEPNLIGSGYVENQNINPGTTIKEGDYLVVELSQPMEKQGDDGVKKTGIEEVENNSIRN